MERTRVDPQDESQHGVWYFPGPSAFPGSSHHQLSIEAVVEMLHGSVDGYVQAMWYSSCVNDNGLQPG